MTRINAGIPPMELHDKHLIAEFRELTRIPNAVRTGRADLSKPIPDTFTLGNGHVRFFYDKLGYLFSRYKTIVRDCERRGFKVKPHYEAWDNIPADLWGHWTPTREAREAVEARIAERIASWSVKPHSLT